MSNVFNFKKVIQKHNEVNNQFYLVLAEEILALNKTYGEKMKQLGSEVLKLRGQLDSLQHQKKQESEKCLDPPSQSSQQGPSLDPSLHQIVRTAPPTSSS